jgi:hypothetical protein
MQAAGITTERIREHFRTGRITVDGKVAHDPEQPALPPARIVFQQPSVLPRSPVAP